VISNAKLQKLRTIITENMRVQRGDRDEVPYIDSGNALTDVQAKQNHVVFGRRGCGKSLLLHYSAKRLPESLKTVYLNCEDFKQHSFPNVLIEILDCLFAELEVKSWAWFGRKKQIKVLITEIRGQLAALKEEDDERREKVKTSLEEGDSKHSGASAKGSIGKNVSLGLHKGSKTERQTKTEKEYRRRDSKLEKLNKLLPDFKRKLRQFFELSTNVTAVFIQVDDFYHLRRIDQPHVMDYLHRLCKDLPLYFKVATLRHASVLFADRDGQPTGAQERHDFQPINVDFTFENFRRTESQLREIMNEFGRLAHIKEDISESLFKGEGFRRLVLAGGGVPRDCLSLFLEAHDIAKLGDGRIGKEDVRELSLATFERRIQDLKQDTHHEEQDGLLRGIYVIRAFCLGNANNVFLVEEKVLREADLVHQLIYRLLDYRIIHSVGTAVTHKNQPGFFHAFAIDVGCYANMRKLRGRFNEIDITGGEVKDKLRSAPVAALDAFAKLWDETPAEIEVALHNATRE
jgi:hypothetical protein